MAKPFSYPSCPLLNSGSKELKFTFNWDILNGKTKDDGPDHSKGHFNIAIHNFYGKKKRVEREEIEDIKLQLQILVKQDHWGTFPFADGRTEIPAKNCFSLPSQMLCWYSTIPSNQTGSFAVQYWKQNIHKWSQRSGISTNLDQCHSPQGPKSTFLRYNYYHLEVREAKLRKGKAFLLLS